MNKIFTFTVVALFAVCWIGCSDDDNDDSPKRKLVSKVHEYWDDNEYEEWKFIYNDDASIKTAIHTVKESYHMSIDTMHVQHFNDKVIIREIETSDYDNWQPDESTVSFILDNQKRIVEYTLHSYEPIYFQYSDEGQLIYSSYMEQKFKWSDGNIINSSYVGYITPSDIENKTNIDLNPIIVSYFSMEGESYKVALNDYWGTRSKNLIQKTQDRSQQREFKYIIDEDGDPVKVLEIEEDGSESHYIEITYTYQ
ncbi:MAG: hypothetical protein SOY65_02255 [Marinifilaceae bacterium]|nr:hypothetical protein [Marinifilaceae bacterium]